MSHNSICWFVIFIINKIPFGYKLIQYATIQNFLMDISWIHLWVWCSFSSSAHLMYICSRKPLLLLRFMTYFTRIICFKFSCFFFILGQVVKLLFHSRSSCLTNFFQVRMSWLIFTSFLLFKKIAEQNGGKYEVAVYASQCSDLKRMLPICTDWEVGFLFLLISRIEISSLLIFERVEICKFVH